MCGDPASKRILGGVGAGLIATYVTFGQLGCGYYDPALLAGLVCVAWSQGDRIAGLIRDIRGLAIVAAMPAIVLFAWIVNAHWHARFSWASGGVDAGSGLVCVYTSSVGPADFSIRTSEHWHWKWEMPATYHKNWSAGGTHVVPMWLIQIVATLPLAVAAFARRKRLGPECCKTCGYNLTSNVSGICPECGQACAQSV